MGEKEEEEEEEEGCELDGVEGGSSMVGSGSWFAISRSELASGVSVGSGIGTGVGVGVGPGVVCGSSSLDNHGIAVSTSAGAGFA